MIDLSMLILAAITATSRPTPNHAKHVQKTSYVFTSTARVCLTSIARSQLYTEAVAEYVARHDPEAITEAMNRVCRTVDTRPDPAVSAAARRVLQRTAW